MEQRKTVTKDGFTVTKISDGFTTKYEYSGVLVWKYNHSKGNRMSYGAGWMFEFGQHELVGGIVRPRKHHNRTLAEAFAEIDRLTTEAN